MWLVKSAPNLMQRLPRLPAAPNVTLLDRRKPKPHPWPHNNTTFTELIYIRWCCIDLSNAPDLSGKWITSGLPVIGDLDCKVPKLKASGFAPRFGCQTTQDQSVGFA